MEFILLKFGHFMGFMFLPSNGTQILKVLHYCGPHVSREWLFYGNQVSWNLPILWIPGF